VEAATIVEWKTFVVGAHLALQSLWKEAKSSRQATTSVQSKNKQRTKLQTACTACSSCVRDAYLRPHLPPSPLRGTPTTDRIIPLSSPPTQAPHPLYRCIRHAREAIQLPLEVPHGDALADGLHGTDILDPNPAGALEPAAHDAVVLGVVDRAEHVRDLAVAVGDVAVQLAEGRGAVLERVPPVLDRGVAAVAPQGPDRLSDPRHLAAVEVETGGKEEAGKSVS